MVAAGSCRYFGFCATIMHLLGAFHGCIAQNEMYVDATASGDVRVPMILVFKVENISQIFYILHPIVNISGNAILEPMSVCSVFQ